MYILHPRIRNWPWLVHNVQNCCDIVAVCSHALVFLGQSAAILVFCLDVQTASEGVKLKEAT